jgi:hypothetical protein
MLLIVFWLLDITHLGLANRTGVFFFEPLAHAVPVKAVETRHDDELFTNFVVALTDGAHLVLLAEILLVGLRVYLKWQ